LTSLGGTRQTSHMDRARRHHRLLAVLAFGLLALVAELAGRGLTNRIDVGRHVARPAYAGADYYPFLLIGVKIGAALLLARLAWRFAKARATARAADALAAAVGARPARRAPRVRVELSPRLWFLSFVATASFYLVQSDAEQLSQGHWSPFGPWLHSSALPVFAVLSVVVAVLYSAVARWLSDYESYAHESAAYARTLASSGATLQPRRVSRREIAPRRLFGLAFESRGPPATA
jgi:hypothetical protein